MVLKKQEMWQAQPDRGQRLREKELGGAGADVEAPSCTYDRQGMGTGTATGMSMGMGIGMCAGKSADVGVDYGCSVALHLFGSSSSSSSGSGSISSLAADFCRLYIRLHCDHGGGNVSAHTSHLVGSAGANPFSCISAAFLALEGPLHGGASAEALQWMHTMQASLGGGVGVGVGVGLGEVTATAVTEYAVQVLESRSITSTSTNNGSGSGSGSGKAPLRTPMPNVIPGFGHAVLAAPDPRATALLQFAQKHAILMQHNSIQLALVAIPAVVTALQRVGKARSPHPNVDAASGLVLEAVMSCVAPAPAPAPAAADIEDTSTLLFALSRSLGCGAQLVLERALELPIERPDSLNLQELLGETASAYSGFRSKL